MNVGESERRTQDRVIKLFRAELDYTYLGDWNDRDNSNIEESLLRPWLVGRGYSPEQASSAILQLQNAARSAFKRSDIYQANKAVYGLLRYGADVACEPGKPKETVWFIDWEHPKNNTFGIAQEVTLAGDHNRRPDLVLYVNGIALGVVELKRSSVSIDEGVRQNITNQNDEFHPWFFSTVQYLFAGNDTQGLRYGTVLTPEKKFLTWKEHVADNQRLVIDKYLTIMCEKARFLEVIHDFVVFDGGIKKLPRPHQYHAVKAAQQRVAQEQGGIIWHTQGSGKSLLMVMLAKWLLEHAPENRVLVVTDRDELDQQIEGVFKAANLDMKRTTSGRDLLTLLAQANPALICSLIHKFGPRGEADFKDYLATLAQTRIPAQGRFYVFVDEAHRSQSGDFNQALKAVLPHAIFIGFTGTPLLKKDVTSVKTFGDYIHTYLIKEAVEDGVILDLVYQARDIDQFLSSPEKVDAYFAKKAEGLNTWQKDELEKRWATKQKVLSAKSRIEKIASDIDTDFQIERRLSEGLGNAIFVAGSIYEACQYYRRFQETDLKNHCAIVTSYEPTIDDLKNGKHEDAFKYTFYQELLRDVVAEGGNTKAKTYENRAKKRFIEEPATMKLLIVVDKLLTGFDAPSCSVIYIDKHMQDHGLFQAICRTNRVDDDSKTAGSVVDYKGLFKKVAGAMAVYSSEVADVVPGQPSPVLIKNRIERAKERIENALEALHYLVEPVEPPKSRLEHIRYFCGNTELSTDVDARAPLRESLYHLVVSLVRAVADLSDDFDATGYTTSEFEDVQNTRDAYVKLRDEIRLAAGEYLDFKSYDSDMRQLIDKFVQAEDARNIFSTEDQGVLAVLEILADVSGGSKNGAVGNSNIANYEVSAEIIENNIRKKIVKSKLSDPVYYEKMSDLLNQVIADRKAGALDYEDYLTQVKDLAIKARDGKLDTTPKELDTPGKRALWNNLGENSQLALTLDAAIKANRQDDWRGNLAKERAMKGIIHRVLVSSQVDAEQAEVERIFNIVREQEEYA